MQSMSAEWKIPVITVTNFPCLALIWRHKNKAIQQISERMNSFSKLSKQRSLKMHKDVKVLKITEGFRVAAGRWCNM